jgi:hypothetical protein
METASLFSNLDGRDVTDLFVTWAAAFGVFAYALYLRQTRLRSTLESRALFLLYCTGTLFLVRGFYWLSDEHSLLGVLTFVPITLFPLACTLFVEALLRRHVSLLLKLYVAVGTVSFLALDLFDRRLPFSFDLLIGMLTFLVSTLAALTYVILRRDRGDLSAAENRLVDAVAAGCVALIPLVFTDYRKVVTWIPLPRMSGIAALLFVNALMRPPNEVRPRRALAWEAFGLVARAAIISVTWIVVAGVVTLPSFVDSLAVALAALLVTVIVERLNALRSENRDASFLHWLLRADTRSADALLGSLRDLPLTEEHITVKGKDLEPYDARAISALFDSGGAVLSLTSLRHQIATRAGSVPQAVEELVHILERYEMTHAALVCHEPATLLLLNLPPVDTQLYEMQVRLIQKHFRLLEQPGSLGASDLPVSA